MPVATSDQGFFDSFKEAKALAQNMNQARTKSDSALVRDLAGAHGSPFGMTASPAEIEQGTREELEAGVAALEAKAPDALPAPRARAPRGERRPTPSPPTARSCSTSPNRWRRLRGASRRPRRRRSRRFA